jgi:lambda family phage portal protein
MILAAFPGWGARRIMRRAQHDLQLKAAGIASHRIEARMEKAFDAADNDRLRGHKWFASRLAPNDILDREWRTLVERCEQEYRNNPIASSAINGRVDNVVGCGIVFQAKLKPDDDDEVDDAIEATNRQFDEQQRKWAAVVKLSALQRQFERCRGIYGEAFLVMSDDATSPAEIPLVLEVIHPRRVETPPEQVGNRNVRLGIEFDKRGRPVAYYVRKSHPDDSRGDLSFERIPADRVCHSFEALFPGQVRGIPWMAPVLPDLKDLKDWAEAHLIAQQVEACTATYIKTSNPYQQAIGAAVGTTSDNARIEEVYPGMVEYLGANDEVHFTDPNRPGNTFAPYMLWRLRIVAAGLRYPVELLLKLFENNMSGGRLALIDGRMTFQCWQQQSIDDCWSRVGRRFMRECIILGAVDVDPSAFLQDEERYLRHSWQPQGWPWVDPVKEVQADVLATNNGLSTKSESLAGRGKDFTETVAQRRRERLTELEADAAVEKRRKELADELGNPAFGMPAGTAGQPSAGSGASDDGVGDRSVEKENEPAEVAA